MNPPMVFLTRFIFVILFLFFAALITIHFTGNLLFVYEDIECTRRVPDIWPVYFVAARAYLCVKPADSVLP